ncbi:MAG: hypothetical protein CML66_26475 [Rhodobacteraceae bacterium]|nr:hypothetical protein [Paracoccaceae bacterium]MAY44186.1 hypothetical protein [Paracoccaceae bacterium]
MPHFPDLIDTGGLRLRPLTRADIDTDIDTIARQLRDPRVGRWLAAVAQPFGAAEAKALLDHADQDDVHLRGIERDGKLVGCLCIGATLWYWLAPEQFAQGIMRQALTAAIAARFATPAPPITATCHEDNAASRALLQRLGFGLSPARRRMFFHGTGRAEPCRDYILAPEQWHLLRPPAIDIAGLTLHPARQTDMAVLARVPSAPGPWPDGATLAGFIETHRFRGAGHGLFVIRDGNRRDIGLALVHAGETAVCFVSAEDDSRHRTHVEAALAHGLTPLLNP